MTIITYCFACLRLLATGAGELSALGVPLVHELRETMAEAATAIKCNEI
jgi:hypothetical protein